MEILKKLYYNVDVSEKGSTSQGRETQEIQTIFHFKIKSWKFCKKTIDNFSYKKYNVPRNAIRNFKKRFKKTKGECINYEKAD